MATKKKTTVTKKVNKKKVGKKTITTTTTVTEVVEEAPAKLENDFVILLDSSGSMATCRTGAVDAYNREVEAIKLAAADKNMVARISLYTFGVNSGVRREYFRQNVATLKPMSYAEFRPDGATPMYECVSKAIDEMLGESDVRTNDNLSIVVHVITDGQATDPERRFSALRNISNTANTGRWTHVFLVPKATGYRENYRQALITQGVQPGNIGEWDTTNEGAAQASGMTNSSVNSYFTSRSLGMKSVPNFYVQPDLSKVTATQVKRTLKDISSHFRAYEVPKEMEVRDFVEMKTKRPYVIGSAYYQLMKTEKKVQPTKHVLLRDKKTQAIYGGEEARDLIGLPTGSNAKVEPGNHANYDIFIESTSVNRHLPTGTKVLVDVTQTVNKQPTWDHTSVQS